MALTRRILIVEADRLARNNFVRTVDGHGFDIDMAGDARAALEMAERTAYAVIVIDDAVRRAVAADLLPQLVELQPSAILMLVATERSFVRVVEAVNNHRVQGVLTKPWSREILVANLRRGLWLYYQRHGQQLAAKALEKALEAAGEHRQVLDEATVLATTWVERHAAGSGALDEEATKALKGLQARFGRTGRGVFSHLGALSNLLQSPGDTDHTAVAVDLQPELDEPELPEPVFEPDNRRRHPRVPLSIDVYVREDDEMWTGTSEDISVGGIFVRTERSIEMNEVLEVEYRLPGSDASVRCRAKVAWIRKREGTPTHGVQAGIGLEFENLPLTAAESIGRFVACWDDDVLEHLELLAR